MTHGRPLPRNRMEAAPESGGPGAPALERRSPERPFRQSTPKGWYSRGYLPHCDHPGRLQAITFRLSDSLPSAAIESMVWELRDLPVPEQQTRLKQKIDAWLDAGHGACTLREPEAATIVLESLRYFDGVRYDLLAFVIMPNHVHVLIHVYQDQSLATIVGSWKKYSSRRIGERFADAPKPFWMRDYWDRYIRDEAHFHAVLAYIHENPVKAGLVSCPQDWPFGSAGAAPRTAAPPPAALESGDPGPPLSGAAFPKPGS